MPPGNGEVTDLPAPQPVLRGGGSSWKGQGDPQVFAGRMSPTAAGGATKSRLGGNGEPGSSTRPPPPGPRRTLREGERRQVPRASCSLLSCGLAGAGQRGEGALPLTQQDKERRGPPGHSFVKHSYIFIYFLSGTCPSERGDTCLRGTCHLLRLLSLGQGWLRAGPQPEPVLRPPPVR